MAIASAILNYSEGFMLKYDLFLLDMEIKQVLGFSKRKCSVAEPNQTMMKVMAVSVMAL